MIDYLEKVVIFLLDILRTIPKIPFNLGATFQSSPWLSKTFCIDSFQKEVSCEEI